MGTKHIDNMEKIVKLYTEKGMTYFQIAEYLSQKGIKISESGIRKKIIEECERRDIKLKRNKSHINREEIAKEVSKLYKEGWTYEQISQNYQEKGFYLSPIQIEVLVMEEKMKKKEETKTEESILEKLGIKEREKTEQENQNEDEDHMPTVEQTIIQFYKDGMAYDSIVQYFDEIKAKVTPAKVREVILRYQNRSRGKEEKKHQNQAKNGKGILREIMLSGYTLDEWISVNPEIGEEKREEIRHEVDKMRFIAEHQRKNQDGTWDQDKSFLEVLNVMTQDENRHMQLSYHNMVQSINHQELDLIQTRYFEDRKDIFSYLLSRYIETQNNPLLNRYDEKLYQKYREEFKNKITNYENRVRGLESSMRELEKKNGTKPKKETEERE